MKSCGNHEKCIVVFEGRDCPICMVERTFEYAWEKMEMVMADLKELRQARKEEVSTSI